MHVVELVYFQCESAVQNISVLSVPSGLINLLPPFSGEIFIRMIMR